jgi:hypothetical protein
MVTLGADSHKATHTVVAVDETGAKLSHVTVKAGTPWASAAGERPAIRKCRAVTLSLQPRSASLSHPFPVGELT